MARPRRHIVEAIQQRPSQLGQPPIISGDRRASEGAGCRLDELEDPDSPREQDVQVFEIAGAAHQGIEPLDPQDPPAKPVGRLGLPSRDIIRPVQQPSRELGLVARDHLSQHQPPIVPSRPVGGPAPAGEHGRRGPHQVALEPAARQLQEPVRVHPRGLDDGQLGDRLHDPVDLEEVLVGAVGRGSGSDQEIRA